jgi:phosphatidylglycerophosphate synthase
MIDTPFRRILAHTSPMIVKVYSRLGLRPNHITVGATLTAAAAAVACGAGYTWLALGLWWASRWFDGTDGIYARGTGQQTDFGAYLDIVGDMAAYSMMILGFMVRRPDLHWSWLGIVFLYVLCISSALALGALSDKRGLTSQDNRGLRLGAGLAEGGETGIAYTLFLLLPQYLGPLTSIWLGILATTVIARTLLARNLLR